MGASVGSVDFARRGVAQPGSAPALGAGSPRFESGRPDLAFSVSGPFRPGATGLPGRLAPLAARRSTGPCENTVPSGVAQPVAPRESEIAIPFERGSVYVRSGATGLRGRLTLLAATISSMPC